MCTPLTPSLIHITGTTTIRILRSRRRESEILRQKLRRQETKELYESSTVSYDEVSTKDLQECIKV